MLSTAVQNGAVARVLGIQTTYKDLRAGGIVLLPQRIALIGQGNSAAVYPTTKLQITSSLQAGTVYGFGSPIHLAARQLFPDNGDGVGIIPVTVYPLEDEGSGAASVGDITPSGVATEAAAYSVTVNGETSESFVIAPADSVATIVTNMTQAIQAVLNMPMDAADNATDVVMTSKWEGTSANDLNITVNGPTDLGITFAITQPVGGLVNPDVTDATALIGSVWESMILNCLEIADTIALSAYSDFGEGRWGALVRKPCIVFTGNTEADVAAATVVSDSRKTDRTNSQLVAPGSSNLPFVVAARQLARIAVLANDNPPHDYGSQAATGLIPGDDSEQWTYPQKQQAILAGSSSVDVVDNVVRIADVVTFYHPTGDVLPAYRYVVDIVKLQNIIFNLDLIFAAPEWDGAPLIPNDDPTVNASAKKPKMAVADMSAMIDNLALQAILSDPATAKANTFAEIDATNPKRWNAKTTVQVSGNSNVKSVDLDFGFFFGSATVVA